MRRSSGGGTRTPDTRIMIPPAGAVSPEENADCVRRAAMGAAVDADLARVVDVWTYLSEAERAAILGIVGRSNG